MSQSFASRAALGSLALAVAASLLTATATGGLASLLLQRAEDLRLQEAAVVLSSELEEEPGATTTRLTEIVAEEHAETTHMGMAFAIFTDAGARLAGDPRLTFLPPGTCTSLEEVRACSRGSKLVVVAGGPQTSSLGLLVAAGLLASLVVGLGAFFVSRPLAATVVAPLSELQHRVSTLDARTITTLDLGPPSSVTEVDSLRQALELLLRRVDDALTHATRFAADAAHELRTPLSTIHAELELLSDGAPSAESLARVRTTLTRLTLLVERLLVLATPGGDEVAELVSLRDVVEDTVAALGPEERARVTIDISGDISLRGDGALLSTMVSNALSNGLKFGRHLTARLTSDALQFDDDGPGVPAEERQRVFEPLYRGAAARAGQVAGHGLGLALIAHVARRHGGTAAFEDGAPGARLSLRFSVNRYPYPYP